MADTRTDYFEEFFDPPPRRARSVEPASRLGTALREARQHARLELEDVAEIINVRFAHLEALEAGRLTDLPADPYGKNFVRLYAQAVGLEPSRALLLYSQARRGDGARDGLQGAGLELPPSRTPMFSAAFDHPRLGRALRPLAAVVLVGGSVWVGLELFNRVLLPSSDSEVVARPLEEPETAPTVQTPAVADSTADSVVDSATGETAAPAMVLLSLRTVPPGAEVSIDGYRFGQTPLTDAPVRAGARVLTVERGGYRTFRRTFDLSKNRNLNVTLLPTEIAGHVGATRTAPAWRDAVAGVGGGVAGAVTEDVTGALTGDVTVTVSAEAWLEVYRGDARSGERLVYETAQPGDRFTFNGPVYVYSGNAGGVSVSSGDAPPTPLGDSGAVTGAAY